MNWPIGRCLSRWTGWLSAGDVPCYTYVDTLGFVDSCSPIYLAELVIWLGWMVLYGSLVIVGVVAAVALLIGPVIVPREERGLEVKFGDVYREFRRTTPR